MRSSIAHYQTKRLVGFPLVKVLLYILRQRSSIPKKFIETNHVWNVAVRHLSEGRYFIAGGLQLLDHYLSFRPRLLVILLRPVAGGH